jgi:hypothetical protein
VVLGMTQGLPGPHPSLNAVLSKNQMDCNQLHLEGKKKKMICNKSKGGGYWVLRFQAL